MTKTYASEIGLAIVLYNALKDKIYDVTPPITNGKNGNGPPPNGDRVNGNGAVKPPAYYRVDGCYTWLGYLNEVDRAASDGDYQDYLRECIASNGNGPVETNGFDITTLPEYAGQVAPDGICPMHYTNVQVSGPYHVCQRSDLV